MAATLTELWSRLLLPADAPEARAAAAEAEALRRQLLERARMREAAGWLERRPQLGHAVFARGMPAATPSGRASDITELLRGCLVALRVPAAQADEASPAAAPALAGHRRDRPHPAPARPAARCQSAERLPAGAGRCRHPTARCAAGPRSPARWWPGWNWPGPGQLALDQDAAWTAIRVGRRHDHRDAATAVPGPAA